MKFKSISTFVTAATLTLACQASLGLTLDLDLAPTDFARTRIAVGNSYTEAVDFSRAVGTISPGEAIDIEVNLLKPIRFEDYFPGAPFGVIARLVKGSPPPTFVHSFSSNLVLPGAENLQLVATQHHGRTSIPQTVRQETVLFVRPTQDFAKISNLVWQYTAPSWTPSLAAVRLELSFQIVRGDRGGLPIPDRNLVAFVPEPSTVIALISAMPLSLVRRRSG